MRVGLVQKNIIVGDFPGIQECYREAFEYAKSQGADAVVYPELATTGYPPRDFLSRENFIQQNLHLVEEMTAWTREGPAIIVGFISRNTSGVGNDFFNSAAVLEDGEHRHTVLKSLLPSYDVFDEDRYFEHAQSRSVVEVCGRKVGLTICEDIWSSPEHWNHVRYPVDPCTELAAAGAELFINISASPFSIGKSRIRREIVSQKAAIHGLFTVYVNQVGAHDELIFDGRSMVLSPTGKSVAQLPAFDEAVRVVDLPLDQQVESTEEGETLSEEEEVYRALVLGVRDYVRKSGFRSVVLGLSGGIDSALTAVIAADALGPENVFGIAMPTRYSSDHSVEDAEALASTLGCRYSLVPIDDTFQVLLDQLSPLFVGKEPDVTEENLQARIRGITLMAVSNKEGSLLLTTGNKSELAVGYCTLYGDMCGALALIADVPKTLVYRLSRWINRNEERIPLRTLEKPPSAELRPDQIDQDSLPPYDILDAIVEGVVELNQSAEYIAEALKADLGEVRRIVRLIHLNEYKRRQAPPVLKVTSKAFGVGRRMPLVAKHQSWS